MRRASRILSLALTASALLAADLGARTAAPAPSAAKPAPAVDPKLLGALEMRFIGPYRGGRSTAVAGVVGDRLTFYMGSTGGGVWKTTDGGASWTNVSDGFFATAPVGALAVAPADPNVVYAGMGSACVRGNISPGDGVYRSTDAGRTWQHAGLGDAGQIGQIRVHPQDPDRAWAAVLGHAFGPNEERGVFRTTDGGKSWQKVLSVSDRTGAVDLALDATNPRILYAAMWQVVRRPWTLESGGEEGGLYKSTDGGDTWKKLAGGLPEGVVGRIGVTVSPARPQRVWALVEAEKGGLFRSEDGGESFKLVNGERKLRQRAWYYTHVFADPGDENTVYVLNTGVLKSIDGGKSFDGIRVPHGDNHALWIDPDDPRILINGNDGGANVSYDGGRSWSDQDGQPTAEIYRVTTDTSFPYRVYGAQQDNSTLSIPSRTTGMGITAKDWYEVGGGESGHIAVDPRDPDIVYAGSYGGYITRYDHRTGSERQVVAYPQLAIGQAPKDLRYRFQWNAPIRISPHDPDVLYHASNFVHRSRDGGQTWEVVSPDLTRNDPGKQGYSGGPITWDDTGVEVYDTIFAFEESPLVAGLLWAGSDDGRVHLSRDGAATWQEVTPRGMPDWGQVNMIDPSPHDPGRALMAVTRYKLDDFAPYLFRTDDYGATWTLLTDGGNGIPSGEPTRVVRADPERRGLLYAGTERGLYVSFDDGRRWQSLQLNLPVTPVTDLAVKNGDLVIATQGRGFWILDDLGTLRQLTAEVAAAGAHLFQPRPAYRMEGGQIDRPGLGKNPPAGAMIFYSLAAEPAAEQELVLEILDAQGAVIRTFSNLKEEKGAPNPWAEFTGGGGADKKLVARTGLNRFVWDLRYPDPEVADKVVLWGRARGPKALPGTYQARLTLGEASETRSFEVLADPRLATTPEDYRRQLDLAQRIGGEITRAQQALETIRSLRDQVGSVVQRMADGGLAKEQVEAARGQAKTLTDKLTAIEGKLTQPKSESSQDPLNFPPGLDNQLVEVLGVVTSADAAPTAGAEERFGELQTQLSGLLADLQGVVDGDLAAFLALVAEQGVPPVVVPRPGGEAGGS